MTSGVGVQVLGSVRAEVDGSVVQPGRQLTRLLAALAVDAPRTVSDDVLMERLWGNDPPSRARASLQVFIGRLRRALEPHRAEGNVWSAIVRDGGGYRLVVGEDGLDRDRVERLLRAAVTHLDADPASALRLVEAALGCWRGDPWADVADEPWIADERLNVRALRARAEALRIDALLSLDRAHDAASAARSAVAASPFDEGARGQLMRALYRSGRQHEALAEFERARRLLVEEVGVDPGPELQRVYAAILDHDPHLGSSVGGDRPSGGVTNLSRPATPFVGRRKELDEVSGRVARARLVTLTGQGGSGKTRLATEVGWRVLEQFPDGVWFVDLDRTGPSDDVGVAGKVAEALSLEIEGRAAADEPLELLCRFVAERRILVILDNCEPVVAPTAGVATRLVAAGPGVHVLATSRRVLGVEGEHVVSVGPLEVPPPGAAKDEVVASPAARLFVLRAGEDRIDLDDAATLDAVTTVVRALDGLPLAIELAAGRLGALSLAGLLDAMADRFSVLVAEGSTGPERHLAVRASLDISHGLLADAERRFFDRLALVNGTFTVELFGDSGARERTEAMSCLDRLVGSSLLERIETAGLPGYRLSETTRAYARLRLEEAGGVGAATDWLTARILDFVERCRILLRGSTQRETLAVLDTNYAAIRSLLEHLRGSRRSDLARPIAVALAAYWYLRPHRGDGARVLAELRAEPDPRGDELWWARLVQAEAECGRGKDNALDRLRPDLIKTIDVFTEHSCDEELATSVALLAVGAAWRGDLTEMCRVRALSSGAVARLRSAWHDAVVEFLDGLELGLSGDLHGGAERLCLARDRFLEQGDRSWAARASYFAGMSCQFLGDDDGFRRHVIASVELSELAGGCGMDGRVSLALADAAVGGGDPRAEWMLLRASDLLERHGDVIGVAKCRRELAFLALLAGCDSRATVLFARSLPVLARLELPALALGLAQMFPLVRRTRTEAAAVEVVRAVRSIEATLAGHSSPDLRRLRDLTLDWPRFELTDLEPDVGGALDAALGPDRPSVV